MAKSIIGQNRDGTYIYGPDSVIAPPTPAPMTPKSTGIPGVGVPQVPGMQPIVPRSLVNATYDESSPEAFKNSIVEKHPDGIASDGRAYKDIPAYEITKMIVDKYPEGVTNAGVPYKNYLVAPRNREEAVMWSPAFQQIKDAKKKRDDYLTGVTQHAEQAISGVSGLGARMEATIESIKKHPWEQMSTTGKQALEGSWLNDISNITAGTLGFATDVLPVTAVTKMAFTEMRDNAVLQYVPKALDLVAEGAVGGLKMTGMDEETANNVVSTIFDLGFLRGGIRGQIKIADAYKARGLQGALETSALIIPQTMVDMALQPFNLGKTAYDFIKGKTSGKSGPQGAGDFKYESSTSGAKGESTQYNAQTSDGTPFNMDPETAPSGFRTFRDKAFTKNATDNVELATRSVFPKATKEKGTSAKMNAGPIALAGIEQMYKDNRTGLTTADISTMRGGVEAIQQSKEIHGRAIGELTGKDDIVQVGDIIDTLKTAMQNPTTQYKGEMKNLANDIIELLGNDVYKNGITVRDLQDHLSTIKSKIFTKHENVSALYGEASGRAIKDFIDEVGNRYDKAIEENSNDLPQLKYHKKAYSSILKIEKDLAASMLVNERNTKGGAMSKAGSIVGLYELLKNPTLSGIATSIITKTILNEMGSANTRGGAYEALIRNLDREALARGPSTSNSYTNGRSNSGRARDNNSGVAPEGPVSGGVDPTQKQIGAPATTKPAEPVSTTQVNPSPGAELANAFEKGITNSKGVTKKMPVQDMLDSYDVLTTEEKQIALDQSPRLREMVDINADIIDINDFTGSFRYIPEEVIPPLSKKYLGLSPEAKKWFEKNIESPKGFDFMEVLGKENRKNAGIPDPVVEEKAPKKISAPEVKTKTTIDNNSNTPQSFQDRFPEYGPELYKLAKKAVENNIEDFASLAPATKATLSMLKRKQAMANKMGKFNKIGIDKMKTKDMFKEMGVKFSPEQELLNDATPDGMTTDDLLTEIKDMYVASEKTGGDSVDDAVARAEAMIEEKMASVKNEEMKKRGSPFEDIPPEASKDLTPEKKSDTVGGMKTNNGKPKWIEYLKKVQDSNNDITVLKFDEFWSLSKNSKTPGMTKDVAWQTWGKAVIKKISEGKSVPKEILDSNPMMAVMLQDFAKTGKNPFNSGADNLLQSFDAPKPESTAQKLRKKFDEDYPVDPAAPETKEAMSEVFRNRSEEKMSFNELDPVQQYLVRSKLYPDYAAKEKENYREYIRSLIPKVSETTKESKISPGEKEALKYKNMTTEELQNVLIKNNEDLIKKGVYEDDSKGDIIASLYKSINEYGSWNPSEKIPSKFVEDLVDKTSAMTPQVEGKTGGIIDGNSRNEISIKTKDGTIIFDKTVKDSIYNGKKEYFQTLSGETSSGDKISIRFMTDSRGETLKILNFASEAKGKGYGTDLLSSVIEDARKGGIKKIIADDVNYHKAKGYWEKQNFKDSGNGNMELDLSKPSLTLSQKSEVKYSKPDLTSEARKYKGLFSDFKEKIDDIKLGGYKNIDGDFYAKDSDGVVYINLGERNPNKYKPTENIDMKGYENKSRDNLDFSDRNVFVDGSNILDGHHRWLRAKTEGKSINVYKAIDIKKEFQKGHIGNMELPFSKDEWIKRLEDVGGNVENTITRFKESGIKTIVFKDGEYKLLDIYNKANKKSALPLSQKSEVKYSEPDSLTKEARKYKTADEFYKAQTDPLLELKKLGKVKKGVAEGTVTTAIDDIGGIDNVTRGTTNINKLETTETINTNSLRYKAIKEEVENGNVTPIIVDEYLRVVDGHHRLAAYKAMGMTEIPVIAPKMTSGVKRTTFSEYKDIWEQANNKQ